MSAVLRAAMVTLGMVLVLGAGARAAEDGRELVRFPEMMQQHMLSNMRDHLRTLEDIFTALADGDADQAAAIAEARIGMSSMSLHGAAEMAKLMPQPMQAMGTELHRAASRFAVAVQNADVDRDAASQRSIFAALRDVGAACNACHAAYRIR